MKKLFESINKKLSKTNTLPFGLKNTILECMSLDKITEKNIKPFMNKKVVAEINEKFYIGNLVTFKKNLAIFNEDMIKKAFKIEELNSIICENKKIQLQEVVRKESDGYHVRSKKGKNLGGPYKSKEKAVKRLKQVEYFKHMKEDQDLILKERLKDRFFKINEEIVNKDNKGRLTKDRQASRDKRKNKAPAKDAKVITGPPGRMDTPEEAKYRFATYLELRGKKDKKKEK
jgi:hypothetical protein